MRPGCCAIRSGPPIACATSSPSPGCRSDEPGARARLGADHHPAAHRRPRARRRRRRAAPVEQARAGGVARNAEASLRRRCADHRAGRAAAVPLHGAFRWPARVALAVGTVLAASVLSVIVEPLTHAAASPLFVAAVTASAWLGGPACGLLATVLATLALDAVMGSTWPSFALTEEAIARLAVFVFVALFVSALDHARRRAESARAVLLERERTARAEAEDANRAKDDFVTMVAHELRTPLTAILGWSAAMTDARLGPALMARALEAIRRNAALQSRIVADLVDLSRLGRGRLSLQLERVDLGGVVAAATDALAMTASPRGIKVVTNVAGRPPVQGDAARLQQVVSNLLGNALKH